MSLFSTAAHLAIAAVILNIPHDLSGSTMEVSEKEVIWGYVDAGQQISEKIKETDSNQLQTEKNNNIPMLRGRDVPLPSTLLSTDLINNEEVEIEFTGDIESSRGQTVETTNAPVHSERLVYSGDNDCSISEECRTAAITNTKTGHTSKDINRIALEEYIRKEIERYKYYPDIAKLRGIEGTVYINFYIGADGTPSSIDVFKSSGSRILDDAGIKTIGMVGKINTLHRDYREIDIIVPITYKLDK